MLELGDARTLALTTPPITEDLLGRWIRGQEVFLASIDAALARGLPHADALAEGHRLARESSGLDSQVLSQVESVARTFCSARLTTAAVARRIAALEATPAPERDEQLARLRLEQQKLEGLAPLRQRFGEGSVQSLLAREATLLELHARLAPVLAGPRG
jgi:hypothetical protein